MKFSRYNWFLQFFSICLFTLISGTLTCAYAAQESLKAESQSEPHIAFASRIIGNDKRFRFIVDFDEKPKIQVYVLDSPKRLIIDLPETVFTLGEGADQSPSSIVKSLRFGTIAPGKSRIVLALDQPLEISSHEIKQMEDSKHYRFILDAVLADEPKFKQAAAKGAKLRSGGKIAWKGARIKRATKDDKRFTIVIDPGHGGIDGGAVGAGKTIEKAITLRFAKALLDQFKNNQTFRVILTREKDVFLSLEERLAIAKRNKADLMISVHADSLRQSRIRGATVYTLSEEGTDELSRQLAETQNRANLIAGLDLPQVDADVSDILIDLTRRETEAFSITFAQKLVKNFEKRIKLIKNPHRAADFYVLRAAEIPSVLLELGYLSNRKDEQLMNSNRWHQTVATQIAKTIEMFFKPRMVAQ